MERREFLYGAGAGLSIVTGGCTSSLGNGDDSRRRSVVVVESFFEAVDEGDIEEVQSYIDPDGPLTVEEQHSITLQEVEHHTVEEFVDHTGEEQEGEDRERSIQYMEDSLSDLREERGYEETDIVYFSIVDHTGDQDSESEGHLLAGNTGDEWLIWNFL